MIFNFSRQGTQIPEIPMSNDDREILEQTNIETLWIESLQAIEGEDDYAV